MTLGRWQDDAAAPMAMEGAAGVTKRVLVGPAEGWEGWVMRLFEMQPGGHTPRHAHPWPHINFVAEGDGALLVEGEEHPLSAGGYACVPAGAEHQFRNTGSAPFALVCIVPEEGER